MLLLYQVLVKGKQAHAPLAIAEKTYKVRPTRKMETLNEETAQFGDEVSHFVNQLTHETLMMF